MMGAINGLQKEEEYGRNAGSEETSGAYWHPVYSWSFSKKTPALRSLGLVLYINSGLLNQTP